MRQRGGGAWGVDESFGTGCLRLRAYRDLLREILTMERRGKPALSRDLVNALKRPRNTMHQQLARLAEDGLIDLDGEHGAVKSVSSTDEGRAIGVRLGAPVLGSVPAGLLRAVPETDGRGCEGEQIYLESWDEALPPNEDYGVFFVRGDSMIGDCIMPGDRVQLEMNVRLGDLEEGEIAVVHVGDNYEATLKHVHYDGPSNTVTLRASNPVYGDIVVGAEEVRVVGAYYGMVRVSDARARRRSKS